MSHPKGKGVKVLMPRVPSVLAEGYSGEEGYRGVNSINSRPFLARGDRGC